MEFFKIFIFLSKSGLNEGKDSKALQFFSVHLPVLWLLRRKIVIKCDKRLWTTESILCLRSRTSCFVLIFGVCMCGGGGPFDILFMTNYQTLTQLEKKTLF